MALSEERKAQFAKTLADKKAKAAAEAEETDTAETEAPANRVAKKAPKKRSPSKGKAAQLSPVDTVIALNAELVEAQEQAGVADAAFAKYETALENKQKTDERLADVMNQIKEACSAEA